MTDSTGLVIKVLQVTGISSGSDNETSDTYCVLSTGTCRFTTRSLPTKRNSSAWPESFLLSPADIKHASQRITPSAAAPNSAAAANSTSLTAGSADRVSTGNTSTAASSSPVLSLELCSSKRWGSDTVTAAGELLLAPYISSLQPHGPAMQARVALRNPKSTSKATGKSGRAAAVAGSGGGVNSSPGLESGWVLGAEVQVIVLELMAVAAPKPPIRLLGPVGSGRGEVPPTHSCSSTWFNPQRAVLYTSGGHVYQTPTVQLLKITLHRAQGLQNLHVDPQAAAAAAAAISKLGVVAEAPSRAERARVAATNAVLDTKVGRSLFNKTSSWFNRNKPSTLAVAGAAVVAAGALSQSPRGQAAAASPRQTAAAAASSGTGSGVALLSPARTSAAQTPRPSSLDLKAAASGAAAGGGRDSPRNSAAAAVAAARMPASAASTVPASGEAAGSGSSSNHTTGDATSEGDGDGLSIRIITVVDRSQQSENSTAAALYDDEGSEEAFEALDPLAVGPDPGYEAAAAAGVDDADAADLSLEDPVSRLQQVTQHLRTASVDTEAVMAALEENGFHATDAPGGAFVYARLSLAPDGDVQLSRVVELRAGGEAVWEHSFWVAVTRPAPVASCVELELFASKDDKSRGRSVAAVKVPLHQLLRQPLATSTGRSGSQTEGTNSSSSKSALPWFKASHTLQAAISDHLHCSLRVTVEAADWDIRADLANLPRALQPDTAAEAAAVTSAGFSALRQQQLRPQLLQGSSSPVSAGSSPRGSPRKGLAATAVQQAATAVVQQGGADTPQGPLQLLQQQQQQQREESTASSTGSPSIGSGVMLNSSDGSSSPVRSSTEAQPASTTASTPSSFVAVPPSVASLDVVMKAFETRKPLDVFFVLVLGPYCVVSSTSHSTHHHSWGWHMHFNITEPADLLTLALFAREDQAGGKRKVGASMLTMFSSSIRLVGKMRVRLSTLTANTPMNISMPLQGERTNLRPGHPSAAVAHLYFNLTVPQLFGSYLLTYFKYTACSPALYLMANAPSSGSSSSSGGGGQENSLELLGMHTQQTTARWLECQPPCLPLKVFRKVQDGGRVEFTLSRTRSNWRRLILLRESLAPARAAFNHLCSWDNYLHSGACYCVILLFGVYPSKVLSVLLFFVGIAIARAATNTCRPHITQTAAQPQPSLSAAVSAPTAASVSAAAGETGGSWMAGLFQHVMPVRAPPAMSDPAVLTPAEEQQQQQQQQGSAVVTDPYTSLKQNYEGLVLFLTTVQNVVDGWAAAGERLQFAFSWSDQLATAVLVALLLLLAVGLWVLGLQVLITLGLLWVFRHPLLRDPLPPPPVNFVARMPTRSDTMM